MVSTAKDNAVPAGSIRHDAWWVQPLLTVLVLGGFIVYATFRTFENNYFMVHPGAGPELLSPFYSPLISIDWKLFGYHVSPALLILPFPLSFRLTCYYYRKAYYRSFFGAPPACSVKGPINRKNYTGEKYFPFVLQNLHRFAFYAAFIFLFILGYDVIKATRFVDGWGVSVGTIVLLLNVVFLCFYTFGCHSCRHLVGGKLDCYSCDTLSKTRYGLWRQVSFLNERHAMWAWISLFGVALTDVYIRFVASGAIVDHVLFKVTSG